MALCAVLSPEISGQNIRFHFRRKTRSNWRTGWHEICRQIGMCFFRRLCPEDSFIRAVRQIWRANAKIKCFGGMGKSGSYTFPSNVAVAAFCVAARIWREPKMTAYYSPANVQYYTSKIMRKGSMATQHSVQPAQKPMHSRPNLTNVKCENNVRIARHYNLEGECGGRRSLLLTCLRTYKCVCVCVWVKSTVYGLL